MRRPHSYQHFFEQSLTAQEIADAEEVGRRRSDANGAHGDGIIDPNRQPEEIDIQGALGELGFTKYYNLPWTGRIWTREEWALRRGEGDVGSIQVKSVRAADHMLVVPAKHRHLTNYPYVLVSLHKLPVVVLAGWCWGTFAVQNRWWNDRKMKKPGWAVPRGALCPMETFNPLPFLTSPQLDTAAGPATQIR